MQSHEVAHQVYGDDLQFVEVELEPKHLNNEMLRVDTGSVLGGLSYVFETS